MKERPIICRDHEVRAILDGRKTQARRAVKPQPKWVYADRIPVKTDDADPKGEIRCPYGQPGDRLWVRETFYHIGETGQVFYKADGTNNYKDDLRWGGPWKHSIHMPRLASRITLEVTGVRCERLQDISVDDCVAEGMDPHPKKHIGPYHQYHDLWESIHGEGSFDSRYVWVVEFKRVKP
jgi:hypothetical protein